MSRSPRPAPLFPLLLVLVPGCTGKDGPEGATQLELGEPLARVGAVEDPRQALNDVSRVVEDPLSGRILVFQRDEARVAVYDSSGAFVARIGGRGGGPGEFTLPANAGFIGDRVWISDVNLRKFSLFDRRTLEHDRDVVLPPTGTRSSPFTTDATGRIVLTESRGETVLWRNADRVLVEYPVERNVARLELAGRHITLLQPFAEGPRLLPTVDGGGILAVKVDEPSLRVLRLDLEGDTVFDRVLPVAAVAVTDAMFDEAVDGLVRGLGHVPLARSEIEEVVGQRIHRPHATLGITAVAIGPGDVLWVGSDAGGANTWWAVDGESGALIGGLALAEAQAVETGSRSHLWVLEKDALDVQYLVRYPLTQASSRGLPAR